MIKTSTNLSYVQGRTILATRKYLDNINSTIRLDNTYVQNQLQNNGILIMNLVNNQSMHKITTKQKERINYVWMYLGVQYISKISTVNGNGFTAGILDGNLDDTDLDKLNYKTTLTSPSQKKSNNQSWRLWRRILTMYTNNRNSNSPKYISKETR